MERKEFERQCENMKHELQDMYQRLDIKTKETQIQAYDQKMLAPTFWDNPQAAQQIIAQQNVLKETVDVWHSLQDALHDHETMYEMLEDDFSDAEYQELITEFTKTIHAFDAFMLEVLFSGPHDANDAYLEIHPGEGGVDAQDFAQILYRMYTRFCEKEKLEYKTLEYQAGDEAGLKSVLLAIKGKNVYGRLKSEAGIHRLIRLSPFDTAKRRHTSFASVSVIPAIDDTIDIVIEEKDLKIDTFRSSGAGGQSVNTTDSAVRITHLPTGIVVTCQNERSQIQNREQAMKILYAKLFEYEERKKEEERSNIAGDKTVIGFGHQIRSYVFHPYNMVKDHRTNYEVGNVADVIDGNINGFIESYLRFLTTNEE